MHRHTRWSLGLALIASATAARAAPGAGTLSDPVRVDAFPYALRATTSGAESVIDAYSCDAGIDESGPELVFVFQLSAAARVTAWIEEAAPVDVDVHLLDDLTISAGVATSCKSRGNRIAEAELGAGTHYVAVDSFNGVEQAGDFVLRLYAIGDSWVEQIVAQAVRWRARRYQSQSGGPQVVHELVVDTGEPGVSIQAFDATGCQTIAAIGEAKQATAGINGGYFGSGGCPPVSLLKSAGQLTGVNAESRGAFGVSSAGQPLVEIVDKGADWPAATDAHGGGPILVKQGQATTATDWSAESFGASSHTAVHPRTWAGRDDSGHTHFGTIDGRRENAAGMSFAAMGAWLASSEVGVIDAVNLDGGGSSQLWIDGATPNGVVNYPSDNTNAEEPTHSGSRPCSGGLFVFAPPYNHPPRFQTSPPTEAAVETTFVYDADAIDLNVDDVLSFSLAKGPAGMTVDAKTGVLSWTPKAADPASVSVELVVADDAGKETSQSWTVSVSGTSGGSGGSPSVDGGAGYAGSSGTASGGATGNAEDADGSCGCFVAGDSQRPPPFLAAWAVFLAAALGRRVRRPSERASTGTTPRLRRAR